MLDPIFDSGVRVWVYWAGIFGTTYKEIKVWVFVSLWPIRTVSLLAIIFKQRQIVQRLSKSPLDT